MIFETKQIILKDGRTCTLRSVEKTDAADMLEYLKAVSGETPFLARYADEVTYSVEAEEVILESKKNDPREFMMVAEVEEELAGNCSLMSFGRLRRISHRCEFAIALKKTYWSQGIGSAMMQYAFELARKLKYEQMELEVVEGNIRAKGLYERWGFREMGKIYHAMKYDDGSYRDEYTMVKIL